MFLNEFVSSEYAAVFLSYGTGPLFKAGARLNPEIEVLHNAGIGKLYNGGQLTFAERSDISKGYTEAGIRVKNLWKVNVSSFGAGVFYRYGNYAYQELSKNFVYKLVLAVSI